MISLRTNLSSIITQQSLTNSTNKLNQAIERMSTGCKINHAGDNAANYSITTDMTTKLNSYQVAEDNAAMGLDMLSTATDSLDGMADRLARLRSLCEQAANGTYGEDSIAAIKAEAQSLTDEITRLYNNTEYNGMKLFGEYTNRGFMNEIETVTPEVIVTNPEDLADAIANNTIIGIDNADVLYELTLHIETAKNKTIVLTNDIDLSDYQNGRWTGIGTIDTLKTAFTGTFDGQGHVITNLNDKPLFNVIGSSATIKNVGIVDCNIERFGTTNNIGGLIGSIISSGRNINITNCYTTGVIQGKESVGGLIGLIDSGATVTISDCYSSAIVSSKRTAGGLVGSSNGKTTINNCYTSGDVSGDLVVAGIVGECGGSGRLSITNSFSTGNIAGDRVSGIVNGSFVATNTCSYGLLIKNGTTMEDEYSRDPSESPLRKKSANLQIGINSDDSCRIFVETGFGVSEIVGIVPAIKNAATLDKIDSFISKVSNMQTSLGAAQNRLESALDSISVNIDNLTSSRSTLRDADIAKESSRFIQQQILQQAAATLMSTANQSPAIALQLI